MLLQDLSLFFKNLDSRNTFWLAYSGGLDSHVLLHICAQLNLRLQAVHINHGLQANAKKWELHCRDVSEELGVSFQAISVNVHSKAGESPEAAARDARYAALSGLMQSGDCLITAHHKNDQAETVLLQLMRGAGPQGLAAMPLIKNFGVGFLLRPLLTASRADLLDYANQNKLRWIEDASNFEMRFDRNYIRQGVLPTLLERWPQAIDVLSRVAENCRDTLEILETVAGQDLGVNHQLSVQDLLQFSEARRNNVLRYWLKQTSNFIPSKQQLCEIYENVLLASIDAQPLLVWNDLEIRRYRDQLYVLQSSPAVNLSQKISWPLTQCENDNSLQLPHLLGILQATQVRGSGIHLPVNAEISIRFREGGERCRIAGRKGTQDLKKLWQEWGVPPWQRAQIPLLYCNEQLASVIGYCICEPFLASSDQMGWVITLQQS